MPRPQPVSELIKHKDLVELKLDTELREEHLWRNHGEDITEALDGMTPGGVAVNCGNLQQITSMGMGHLVNLYKQLMPRKVPFGLIEVPGMIQGVFKMVNLNRVFKYYRDLDHFREEGMGTPGPTLDVPEPADPAPES